MFWKLLLHGIPFSSGVSPTFAVIIIQCKPPSAPTVLRPSAGDDSIRGENKTSPLDSVWGPREGSAREAGGGRGRDRKNEKKEGGDYRRLLSRIRLVIIVISTVRNARVSASVCVKREKRGEERKLKRGQRKEDGERERNAVRQRRD